MDTTLTVSREDRKCWTLLDRIDQHTLDTVKFFKADCDRLYAALNDGRLIAAGNNGLGRLGLGHTREVKTFAEITTLKGMSIKDIACGNGHVMVLTEDGQLWGWGWNEDGQVGVGDTAEHLVPKRILDKDIVEVKCGHSHTLALKKNGKVLAWGWNGNGEIGINNKVNQLLPVSPLSLEDVIIDKIEAGSNQSIAIRRDGKAYGWGSNCDYELGLTEKGRILQPVPLTVHNHNIKSVACSREHTLFLTEDGQMYVTNTENATLTLLHTEGIIEHIACVNYNLFTGDSTPTKLFLAWSSAKLYYWGDTQQGKEAAKPIPTHLSLSQIISQYCWYQAFPALLYMQQEEETGVREITSNSTLLNSKVADLFDSAELSDIEFVFPGHRSIKAHRFVLSLASPSLSTKLSSTWQSLSSVSLATPSYSVFYNYLFYLYTRTLSFDDFDQLVSLARLAHDYQEVDLKQVCAREISSQLCIENCSQVFELAIDLQLEHLEIQASEMILQKIAQVRITEGFKNMNAEKSKRLFDKM